MEKTIFDNLTVEITRRCNMYPVCKHCYRGVPQDLDLSESAIDNLLDRTVEIGTLNISGGEPLVNLKGIKYLFDGIVKRGISVGRLAMTTNGLLCPDDFISAFLRMSEYMDSCRSKYADALWDRIIINASVDQFHSNGLGKPFLEKCAKAFEDAGIIVRREMYGIIPSDEGLGKNLRFSIPNNKEAIFNNARSVEYIVPGQHQCCCPEARHIDLLYASAGKRWANVVVCPLTLDAKGRLLVDGNYEYGVQDNLTLICNFNDGNVDLMDAVRRYNTGKQACWTVKKTRPPLVADAISQVVSAFANAENPIVARYYGLDENDRLHYASVIDNLAGALKDGPECNIVDALNRYRTDLSKFPDFKLKKEEPKISDEDFGYFLDAFIPVDGNAVRCRHCGRIICTGDGERFRCKDIAHGIVKCDCCGALNDLNPRRRSKKGK